MLARLSGGGGQGPSAVLDIVLSLNGSLGVGGRPIHKAGLVGGL